MKKKFRKTIALLAAAAMALALPACQQDSGEIHSLEFPDASWGIFAEEVMDTYEVTQADLGDGYQIDDTGNGSLTIPGVSAFGEASEKIVFQFAWTGELEQVWVYYPEDADMEKVLEGMKAEYGEPARSASKYTAKGEEAACDSGGESLYWMGSHTLGNMLDGNQQENLREQLPEMDDSVWKKYLQNPESMAYWSTEHRSDPGLYPTEDAPSQENLVVLDGTHAVEAMEAGAVACPVVRVEE